MESLKLLARSEMLEESKCKYYIINLNYKIYNKEMNNFSGYLGLPNLSYITADDLDISNLVVDTITVNTELKTNNIQPLASNDDIDIGLGTNTGTINLNQNTTAVDLEVSNILVVDNIQPSTTTNNIVVGTNGNTGIIQLEQDTEVDNLQVNVELKTENIQPINPANDIIIGTYGNTAQIIHYQNTAIYDGLGVSTTYPVSTYNAQLIGNGVNIPAKLKLVNESSGEGCYVELNRGDYDFGADADRDWRILNDLNGYFYLQSGQSAVIKDYITAGDDEFHITNTNGVYIDFSDLIIAIAKKLTTNRIEPTTLASAITFYSTGTSTFTIGNTANTNPIRMNQNVSIGTNTNTRQLNVSNEQNTANNNYLLLLNTAQTTRENGIQIRNQNGGVFVNEWYIYTPANSTDLRFYTNGADRITLSSGGNMTFASGGQIFMPSNGPIYTLFIRNSGAITNNSQLYDTTTTGTINFGTGLTSGQILMGNSTQTGRVIVRCNFDVGSNASQKGISCAYYQAYDPANTVSLFPTNTTGIINLGQALTTANINIHNTGGSGSINLNANTTLATGKSLTFSTTSDLKVNSIQPINVGDTTNIMTTSTAQINIGNPASVSALAISNTISMASAKNIYLPNTNQRIECNNFESFTNSNPVEMYRLLTGTWKFGNTLNLNNIEFYQNLNLTTKKLLCLTYTSTSTANFINFGETGDGGIINVYRSMYFQDNKSLILGTSSTLNVNKLEPVSVADAIVLYGTSTGTVNIGNNASTNKITFNQPVLMNSVALYVDGITASASNVPLYIGENTDTSFVQVDRNLYAMKTFFTDSISAITPLVSSCSLYSNATTSSVNIATGLTTGFLTLGGTAATTGTVRLQPDTEIAFDKSLFVSTLKYSNYKGSGTTIQLYPDITSTGSVNIMSAQTTAHLNLGNASATSGRVKFLNSSIESNATSSTTNLFNNQTTGSVNMATGLTTGNLVLAGAQTTGRVVIGNQSATPSSGNGHITAYNRIHNSFSNGAFMFNVNSGTNLFNLTTGGALGGKQLTNTMYASAPTDNFNCIEGNSGAEGCAWLMNGDTSIVVNPGDQSSLWWLDEDSFTTANNWAWTGYKISTTGVITASSDRRTKRDITPIIKENLLETLSKVQFVNYKKKAPSEEKYYKNGEFRRKYKEIHMGVIAQDVKQAGLPEVCEKENEDSYWSVKYQDLGLYFNMGVQELIKENIQLKERVSKMENFLKSKYPDFE